MGKQLRTGNPLPEDFYSRPVLEVAEDLVGCLVSFDSCVGVIVETEAYHHSEPACHAFVGLTPRTKTLFGPPGHAYVYRSYGVHAMLNAVSEAEGVGAGVLIRAVEPVDGLAEMKGRRGVETISSLCSGPGKLTQAFGIGFDLNGSSLQSGPIKFYPRENLSENVELVTGPRIGITRAVDLPWRFCAAGSSHVSRPRPKPLLSTANR